MFSERRCLKKIRWGATVEGFPCWPLTPTSTHSRAHMSLTASQLSTVQLDWAPHCRCPPLRKSVTLNVASPEKKHEGSKNRNFCWIGLSLSYQLKDQRAKLPNWHFLSPVRSYVPTQLEPLAISTNAAWTVRCPVGRWLSLKAWHYLPNMEAFVLSII